MHYAPSGGKLEVARDHLRRDVVVLGLVLRERRQGQLLPRAAGMLSELVSNYAITVIM